MTQDGTTDPQPTGPQPTAGDDLADAVPDLPGAATTADPDDDVVEVPVPDEEQGKDVGPQS